MTKRDILSTVIFLVGLVLLTSLASVRVGKPDREAAVAAALKSALSDFISEDEMVAENPSLGFAVMCVETEPELDVGKLAKHLSRTIIRPIPIEECTSKTVEGDFGMFTALTTYYDKRGEEAGHFKIVKADCAANNQCVVDLDFRGWGDRFIVKRQGSIWNVVGIRPRWMV